MSPIEALTVAQIDTVAETVKAYITAYTAQAKALAELQQAHAALLARLRKVRVSSSEFERECIRQTTPTRGTFEGRDRVADDAASLAALLADLGKLGVV